MSEERGNLMDFEKLFGNEALTYEKQNHELKVDSALDLAILKAGQKN